MQRTTPRICRLTSLSTVIFIVVMLVSAIGAGSASAVTSHWWPGNPPITQGYGPTSYSFEPPEHGYLHWHSGIDVGMRCGTPLYTAYAATVVNDADNIPNGFGAIYRTLRLDDGHDVILGHVQRWYVPVRTRIAAGTHVADVGTQGNSTGCHVHFEVRPAGGRFGSDINPTQWMAGGPPPVPTHPIVNQAHGLCLDAAAQTLANNGGIVQLWSCVGDANQRWYSKGNEIVNGADGKCLDAKGPTDANYGGVVEVWVCNGGANQQWVPNGQGQLVNQAHGLCLDANWSTDGSSGGLVQLWGCNSGANQQWRSSTPQPTSYVYTAIPGNGQTLFERSGPSTGYAIKGSIPNRATIHIVCQTTGSTVNGSDIWDKLTTGWYVTDYYTSTPVFDGWSAPIPHPC